MILKEVMIETLRKVCRFIKRNLKNFSKTLSLMLPFAMYFAGQMRNGGKEFKLGAELLIPFGVFIIIYLLNACANKIGKGTTMPIPKKRFTEIDDYDEVSIRNDRVQELILYMADLENWMERKRLLK